MTSSLIIVHQISIDRFVEKNNSQYFYLMIHVMHQIIKNLDMKNAKF